MKKLDRFLRTLGSVRVAIGLMIVLAVLIAVGTFIPQGDPKPIVEGTLPELVKQFLLYIQANQMYTSPLFLFFVSVFLISLALATEEMVWPNFRKLFNPPPKLSGATLSTFPVQIPLNAAKSDVEKALRERGYRVDETPSGLSAHKGRWSRSAPFIAHISLFLILIGALVGGFFGFKSQAVLAPGEWTTIGQVVQAASIKGPLLPQRSEWGLKLNRFWIDEYPDGSPKQYYSDLSIVDANGRETSRKTIWVNEKLHIDGVDFYQSSWLISHVKLKIAGQEQLVPMRQVDANSYASNGKIRFGDKAYVLFNPAPKAPVIAIDDSMQPAAALVRKTPVELGGVTAEYVEPVLATGLQVKSDPGIPFIYLGFVIMAAALCLAFFSWRQVGFYQRDGVWILAGKANRGQFLLDQELESVAESLHQPQGETVCLPSS